MKDLASAGQRSSLAIVVQVLGGVRATLPLQFLVLKSSLLGL